MTYRPVVNFPLFRGTSHILLPLLMLLASAAWSRDLPASLADAPLYRFAGDSVERSEDGGVRWFEMQGLPTRSAPEELAGRTVPVTAFTTHPSNFRQLLVATGRRLFHSESAGAAWSEIEIEEPNESTYFTALAISSDDKNTWAVGTSYDGLYLTTDAGRSWTAVWDEPDRGPFYLGAGFYDEIAGLEFAGTDLLIRAGFNGGYAILDLSTGATLRLRPVVGGPEYYRSPHAPASLLPGPAGPGAVVAPVGDAARRRRDMAGGKTGIYVAAANATADRLGSYLDLIQRRGFNSIVVDLKDDLGRVTYDTKLETPRRAGAVDVLVDVPDLVARAHEAGVYVIARIVLFKDRVLYRYEGSKLALWDSRRDAPWGVFRSITDEESGEVRIVQVEHWVDPNSPEVRDYNLRVAEEVAGLGVDEIQFDYVRFPSDGDTSTIVSRYAPDGYDRVQVLETFLAEARRRIPIPIGIDVYGFNAWSRMSYLGQDVGRLARYVDVISPMFYPSHFARAFLPNVQYLDRSRLIYEIGTERARSLGGGTLIRPYVQAFLIGEELDFEEPEYFRYLELQLQGAAAAASDGYTLWNASGRYYMLR